MVQILTLDVKLNVAKAVGKALQMGNGRRSALKFLADAAKLGNKFTGLADGKIRLGDLLHRLFQLGRNIGAAIFPKKAVCVGIMLKIGVLGGGDLSLITTAQGGYLLCASLPIAIVGLISAQYQSKAAVAGINLISKQKDKLGNAITNAALVETYAILALLISMLLIMNFSL